MQHRDCPDIMKLRDSALQVRGLTKRFDRLAVDALDLTVRSGEFYALVGPNGAGKPTTLRMVAGLSRPDAGTVSVFGIDALDNPVAAKPMMACVSDEPMIYDKLTPLEYLEFVAGLWGVDPAVSEPAAHHLLISLGLAPHLGERCEGFSKGMRQKVALAGALVHDPCLIILDEPLTGLDAVSARHVKGLLGDRVRSGCTVVGRLADRKAPLDKSTLIVMTATIMLAWALMLSQAIESVTRVFYARADLDLIMSSPVRLTEVFSVRIASIALTVIAMALLLSTPFVDVLLIGGGIRWFAAYGVVVAIGLSAAAAVRWVTSLFC